MKSVIAIFDKTKKPLRQITLGEIAVGTYFKAKIPGYGLTSFVRSFVGVVSLADPDKCWIESSAKFDDFQPVDIEISLKDK